MATKTTRPRLESTGRETLNLEEAGALQMGFWVPNRVFATLEYLVPLRAQLEENRGKIPLHYNIRKFQDWVTTHSVYRMLINRMIEEGNAYVAGLPESTKHKIKTKDGDTLEIYGYDDFFEYLNMIVHTSPAYNDTVQVGTPMNGFLAIVMGTVAGAALFHDATFNAHFKGVLDAWNEFLKSPASLDKLNIECPQVKGSWISKQAIAAGVWKDMVHDPNKPGYGYDSWNSFFIRPFVKGARPFQGDGAVSINLGCESTPWSYVDPVLPVGDFWIKDVSYSLLDLFGGRMDKADLFDGGQVYQGFLSATHYHRWHAPLDGELVSSWVQPGTYFAQRPDQGEDAGTWKGTESQPYLGHVAARAIFIFHHPVCGYVAMICIGMVEVSTCVIDPGCLVKEGEAPMKIERGREIGHFEFGGSTHIMVFQRGKVELVDWARNASQHQNDKQPMRMGSVIATAITH